MGSDLMRWEVDLSGVDSVGADFVRVNLVGLTPKIIVLCNCLHRLNLSKISLIFKWLKQFCCSRLKWDVKSDKTFEDSDIHTSIALLQLHLSMTFHPGPELVYQYCLSCNSTVVLLRSGPGWCIIDKSSRNHPYSYPLPSGKSKLFQSSCWVGEYRHPLAH